MIGYICGPRVYEYNGITFENNYMGGPWRLKKDGSPCARCGKKFYKDIGPWIDMPEPEQEKHRIGGGCREI